MIGYAGRMRKERGSGRMLFSKELKEMQKLAMKAEGGRAFQASEQRRKLMQVQLPLG